MIRKLNIKTGIASLMAPIVLLTGCGKSECTLLEDHLHKYVNGSFVRYLDDEHLNNSGYTWTEDLIYVKHSDMPFYEFETKKDLLKIEENEEALRESAKNLNDYIEYEYKYTATETYVDDKGNVKTRNVTKKSWTTDPNHSRLTDNVRLCKYTYTGYKIDTKDNGKYKLNHTSEYYDIESIISKKDEYPYMKVNFYDIKIAKYGDIKNGTIRYNDGTVDYVEDYKVYKKH
jgi:hypothetical protein